MISDGPRVMATHH